MPYSEMLNEFSRELSNAINGLTRNVQYLQAWNSVIAPLSDEKKVEATFEFVDVLGTVSLNLPHVIFSRFIFATAHLSHQANRAKEHKSWKDDLSLDNEIYMADADRAGSGWQKYNRLKRRMEAIAGRQYRADTQDFRNAYNHRFSPRFVVGMTNLVSRRVAQDTGHVSYGFGGVPPLDLGVVADLLVKERDRCYLALEAFQNLVREQEAAIISFSLPD